MCGLSVGTELWYCVSKRFCRYIEARVYIKIEVVYIKTRFNIEFGAVNDHIYALKEKIS